MKPVCITFAGPAGCSKTPVAYYLSWNLNLPIFSNDVIRTEVHEDTLSTAKDSPAYFNRRQERFSKLLNSGKSFIYDASIDRRWPELKKQLSSEGYQWIIISFNLSQDLLGKMAKVKGYTADKETVNKWYKDHQDFWNEYHEEVDCVITDENFNNRLNVALKAVTALKGKIDS